MRVRSPEREAPTKEQIENLRRHGGSPNDQSSVAERLRQSCYLDDKNRRLSPKQRLIQQYRKDGLVLFLGAGVSKESGIPNWGDLIKRLLLKAGINANYEDVNRAFPSLLSQFDLAAYATSGLEFARNLYECLYQNVNFKELLSQIPRREEEQADWPKWETVKGELRRNKTLRAVGELLIIEKRRQLRRNPQIHAVLTTNADNLLEIYCAARTAGKARLLTMVDRSSVGDHPDAISVYHLHGSLDARDENFTRTDEPCKEIPPEKQQKRVDDLQLPDLVFRESEYFQTIANPVSYVNHAPQSYFQRLNVLFIGTSLDDINIRRWLYNSFRERVEHRTRYLREYYCPIYKDAEFEAELASIRHFWLRTTTECSDRGARCQVPTDLVDLSARELGIEVIWCKDYLAVHKTLMDLKKHGYVPDFGRRAQQPPSESADEARH